MKTSTLPAQGIDTLALYSNDFEITDKSAWTVVRSGLKDGAPVQDERLLWTDKNTGEEVYGLKAFCNDVAPGFHLTYNVNYSPLSNIPIPGLVVATSIPYLFYDTNYIHTTQSDIESFPGILEKAIAPVVTFNSLKSKICRCDLYRSRELPIHFTKMTGFLHGLSVPYMDFPTLYHTGALWKRKAKRKDGTLSKRQPRLQIAGYDKRAFYFDTGRPELASQVPINNSRLEVRCFKTKGVSTYLAGISTLQDLTQNYKSLPESYNKVLSKTLFRTQPEEEAKVYTISRETVLSGVIRHKTLMRFTGAVGAAQLLKAYEGGAKQLVKDLQEVKSRRQAYRQVQELEKAAKTTNYYNEYSDAQLFETWYQANMN